MKRIMNTALTVLMAGAISLVAQQKGASKGPMPKSKGESEAVNALIAAQQKGDADAIIAAAENLVTKYKDTEYRDTALYLEAIAYQQKGDKDKMQVYLERTLTANPKHLQAPLMLAEMTIQGAREHDLDLNDKLAKADKYANDAITNINAAEKPNPQLTDTQWEEAKKDMLAEAHDALGLSALERKNYDQAISEFKTAVEGAAHPQPAYEVRLASAYQQAGKNDDAVTVAEKIMAEPACGAPPAGPVTNCAPQQIKSIAQAVRAAAKVAQNGGKPLTAPATQPPPQVQIQPKQ
jgi:Tfp pilus assembly protein PilF